MDVDALKSMLQKLSQGGGGNSQDEKEKMERIRGLLAVL